MLPSIVEIIATGALFDPGRHAIGQSTAHFTASCGTPPYLGGRKCAVAIQPWCGYNALQSGIPAELGFPPPFLITKPR